MKASPERAARLSLAQVRALLARQAASGLSLTAFARREGIPFARLAYYRRRSQLAQDQPQRATAATSQASTPAGFVRVEPPDTAAAHGATADPTAVFIHCPGGTRLEVHAGFDPALVLSLVGLLQAQAHV